MVNILPGLSWEDQRAFYHGVMLEPILSSLESVLYTSSACDKKQFPKQILTKTQYESSPTPSHDEVTGKIRTGSITGSEFTQPPKILTTTSASFT